MRSARLLLALDAGLLTLPPQGVLAVYRPTAADDLSALSRAQTRIITGFRPDHDHFAAAGFTMGSAAPHAAALVCLPRARAAALDLIARAMAETAPGGTILVDGQKTDGIEAILTAARARGLQRGDVIAKAHGRAFGIVAGPPPPDWIAAPRHQNGFVTTAGVFSADGPDPASVLLAAALPPRLPGRIADLGAGWGFLSRAILAREGVQCLDVIEAEAEALDCARQNLPDPRARFHWADATRPGGAGPWDTVVMNPPFHNGRSADPALGLAFIAAAQRGLTASGHLWMVANRHLPYMPALTAAFAEVSELPQGTAAFRLIHASRPIRRG